MHASKQEWSDWAKQKRNFTAKFCTHPASKKETQCLDICCLNLGQNKHLRCTFTELFFKTWHQELTFTWTTCKLENPQNSVLLTLRPTFGSTTAIDCVGGLLNNRPPSLHILGPYGQPNAISSRDGSSHSILNKNWRKFKGQHDEGQQD